MYSIPENKTEENLYIITDPSSSVFLTPTNSNKHDGYYYDEKSINEIMDQSATNTIKSDEISTDGLIYISDEFKVPTLLDEKENRDEECNNRSLLKRKNNNNSMIYCSLKNMKENIENKQKQQSNQSNNVRKLNRIVKSGKSSSILDLRQEFIELSSISHSQCPSSPLRELIIRTAQNNISTTTISVLNENYKLQTPQIGYSTITNNNENNNNRTIIFPLNKRKNNNIPKTGEST